MIERAVEDALVRGVEKRGGEVRKLSWLGRRHAPDRLVLWPYAHHFVELKRPGKRPREGQAREHERLRKAGCTIFNLDTIEKVNTYLTMWWR